MRNEDLVNQFMEIMNDRSLIDVHRMDKLKELAAEWREYQYELIEQQVEENAG